MRSHVRRDLAMILLVEDQRNSYEKAGKNRMHCDTRSFHE